MGPRLGGVTLGGMADDGVVLEAAGHELTLTHPDKVFFAERGETKLDLVRFYEAVGGPLLAAMGGRPVLLQRFPNGAGNSRSSRSGCPSPRPEWLQTAVVSTPNGTTSDALVVADLAHVAWAVNLGCLGFHVWPTRAADLEHADELRIDLDPTPGVTFPMVREAAAEVRDAARRARCAGRKTTATGASTCTCAWSPGGQLRGPVGGRRRGPRAGAAPTRPDHRRVVEGGARRAGLHRLQPERTAQDGVRRLVRAGPAGRAGVDALPLGRAGRRSTPTASPCPSWPPGWRPTATRGAMYASPSRSTPCWPCTGATWPPA